MNVFKKVKDKTILISMIISYLILFFTPILLGVMGYVRMENVLEKNIQNFFDTKVELVSNEMKQCMATLSDSVNNISTNDFVKEFSEGKHETDYSSIKKFIGEIDSDINRMAGVKYMGVYFKNSDVFVTNQGFFSSEQFYRILGETGLNYDEWKTKYVSGVAFDNWSFPGESGENIIYTQSLPISHNSNINEYFFAVFPKEIFKTILVKSGFSKDDKLIIYDMYKGDIYGEVKDSAVLVSLKNNTHIQEKFESFKDDGTLIRLKPIKSNWKVGILTYELSALKEVSKLRTILIICLIIYSMFGMAMIAFYIRKNYEPIRTIISELEKSDSSDRYDKGNEFNYIKNQIIANNKFIDKNYNILQTSKNMIKIQTIYKLLNGIGADPVESEEIKAMFPEDYCILLL